MIDPHPLPLKDEKRVSIYYILKAQYRGSKIETPH
jgi:hypothetical protein